MRAKNGQSLVPLMWVTAALLSGVALHIDRVPLWASATALLWVGWRFAAELRSFRLPSPFAKVGVTLLLIVGRGRAVPNGEWAQRRHRAARRDGLAEAARNAHLARPEHRHRRRLLPAAGRLPRSTEPHARAALSASTPGSAVQPSASPPAATSASATRPRRCSPRARWRSPCPSRWCCSCSFRAWPARSGRCRSPESATTGLSDSMSPGSISALGESIGAGVPRSLRRRRSAAAGTLLARPGAARLRRLHVASASGQYYLRPALRVSRPRVSLAPSTLEPQRRALVVRARHRHRDAGSPPRRAHVRPAA